MMKIKELTSYLESLAPLSYQESYDNSGLIVGNPETEVQKALISLDCTEEVVEEAVENGCNLIISHHPIIFKGLKRLNGSNYVERIVLKAIKNDVALYAIHTNLDNIAGGVNFKIAEKLGLEDVSVLSPKSNTLRKLSVYVPRHDADSLRKALFRAGAGSVGNYEECSFNHLGYGTFKPVDGATPFIGELGVQERVEETKIEVVFPAHREREVLIAMYASHPYEEVAHNLIDLNNSNSFVGSGAIGNLKNSISSFTFLQSIKEKLNVHVIRYTNLCHDHISRVAICGGSGSFLLKEAKRSGADIFITSDVKYHEFFDADQNIILADVGHYESEQFTQELLLELIQKKFPNFAVRVTETHTNPINYYC